MHCEACGGDEQDGNVFEHTIFGQKVNLHCDCVADWMILTGGDQRETIQIQDTPNGGGSDGYNP